MIYTCTVDVLSVFFFCYLILFVVYNVKASSISIQYMCLHV